jgi:hypothetical protein
MMTLRISDNGVDRDMTEAEIAAHEIDVQKLNEFEAQMAADKLAKQNAKEAALAKLGLTEAEIAAILS